MKPAFIAILAVLPSSLALVSRSSVKRGNRFDLNYPPVRFRPQNKCESCRAQIKCDSKTVFDCQCTYSNLQSMAQCVACSEASPGGNPQVNGTSVNFQTYMSAFLDSCYDDHITIPASVYSSITKHTALPSTVPATTTPRPTPTTPVGVSTTFADFRAPPAALSGSNELCYAAIWDYTGDCDYKGTVFFPKSTCSGTACSLSAATPIMCFDSIWCGVPGIDMPSSIVCDNGFRQLTTGSTLSQVVASGTSSSSRYYSCNCNGPPNGAVQACLPKGGPTVFGVANPASSLQCNLAEVCYGGASYNPQTHVGNHCEHPFYAISDSSGVVQQIQQNDNFIQCNSQWASAMLSSLVPLLMSAAQVRRTRSKGAGTSLTPALAHVGARVPAPQMVTTPVVSRAARQQQRQ
ncbi:hypothetical protein EHS25_000617 [Saitozyma podzolica]|uniref:Extracellular membrane protein CFEM domain-containing protein n=1 Tax=Saitozyma podzolica TaxID=1890683 RepID=A0A427YWW4_9TREE|nr:hypothetical protein EHS25_000617 [Saitozyma podzolica]